MGGQNIQNYIAFPFSWEDPSINYFHRQVSGLVYKAPNLRKKPERWLVYSKNGKHPWWWTQCVQSILVEVGEVIGSQLLWHSYDGFRMHFSKQVYEERGAIKSPIIEENKYESYVNDKIGKEDCG